MSPLHLRGGGALSPHSCSRGSKNIPASVHLPKSVGRLEKQDNPCAASRHPGIPVSRRPGVQATRRPTTERQRLTSALYFSGEPFRPVDGGLDEPPKSRSSCCPLEWTLTVWERGRLRWCDGRLARTGQGPCCQDNAAVCVQSGHRWHQLHVCWLSELLCLATERSVGPALSPPGKGRDYPERCLLATVARTTSPYGFPLR